MSKQTNNKETQIKPEEEVTVTESECRKQRIGAICNHILENQELQRILLEQEQALFERQTALLESREALARRKITLKRELVDKLLYKRVDGKKEKMGDDDAHFDVVLNSGLREGDIDDIAQDMHYN